MLEAEGDLWTHPADYRVVTTNGVTMSGRLVMGRGVALQAKQRFPNLPEKLGGWVQKYGNRPFLCREERLLTLPTKHHWKDKSDINLIRDNLNKLVALVDKFKIKSVVLPRPGCDNGKLNWLDVRPLLEKTLDDRFTVLSLPDAEPFMLKLTHSWQNPYEGAAKANWYPELWSWLVKVYKPESVLDLGCREGWAQAWFHTHASQPAAWGVDHPLLVRDHVFLKAGLSACWLEKQDFRTGPWNGGVFDLVWCAFVGNDALSDEEADNLLSTVEKTTGKALAFVVRSREPSWWAERLAARRLFLDQKLTEQARSLCLAGCGRTLDNPFRKTGFIFTTRGKDV